MKILYYNWIQFDNKKNWGGGVNVYQYNLINELKNNPSHDIFFLSSGAKYNPFYSKYYIKKTKNIFSNKCKSFEIINSPIMAPALSVFMNPQKFIRDEESYQIFKNFCTIYGPFDVIHFNNIEGISTNVLKIKEDFPKTKIVISIHNYQPICPLVQYFQNHNQKICDDFKNGSECLKCPAFLPYKEYLRKIDYFLTENNVPRFITKIVKKIFKFKSKYYIGDMTQTKPLDYFYYRKHNIDSINKYADCVLAVSNRVKEIMVNHGVNNKLIKTSYIGTKFAEFEIGCSNASKTTPFTICYLGYPRVDKGYFFLLDALSKLPKFIKEKINIVLAVANINESETLKILHGFKKITVYNGYKHSELKNILSEVNLGIVPVLWEDNLPQVAIEMVACGVPILCSSFGGASELCTHEKFKFEGGNISSFIEKLTFFVNNPSELELYWKNHPKLTSMAEHISELEKIYLQ